MVDLDGRSPRATRGEPDRAAAVRPRRLQALQRRLRPSRRRRAARAARRPPRGRARAAAARAYRLGGDEFCALVSGGEDAAEDAAAPPRDALSEHGERLRGRRLATASCCCRRRRASRREALQIADRRLYVQKGERQRASRDAPDRRRAAAGAAGARARPARARRRGRPASPAAPPRGSASGATSASASRCAAELHDVGKMAVPDAILDKPGPLDEAEWGFMRQHTVVGERILRAAPGARAGRAARARQPRALRRHAATPTGSPARRSRSAPGSSRSATPSTR